MAGCDNIFTHLEFTKLSVHVENYRHVNLLAFAKEGEISTSDTW